MRSCNYEVETSETVASGLDLAKSQRFDLYLLDSRLPDGSGLDFCRELRAFDAFTPILFYSAAAYDIDKQSAFDCGAQGYLTKPTASEDLCALVKSLKAPRAFKKIIASKPKPTAIRIFFDAVCLSQRGKPSSRQSSALCSQGNVSDVWFWVSCGDGQFRHGRVFHVSRLDLIDDRDHFGRKATDACMSGYVNSVRNRT
ncbi:MAG: response regulator [bacterium]